LVAILPKVGLLHLGGGFGPPRGGMKSMTGAPAPLALTERSRFENDALRRKRPPIGGRSA
jgi:hypothetical protein